MDAETATAEGSTIALRERCSGKLKKKIFTSFQIRGATGARQFLHENICFDTRYASAKVL